MQYVFLEKADQPTAEYGNGIPRGILMLTSKRLFFFSTGNGEIPSQASKFISIIKEVAGTFIPNIDSLVDLIADVTEYGIKNLKVVSDIDFEPFLSSKDSFVVPIESIVTCEKFGHYYLPHFGVSKFSLKRKYTRIGIIDGTVLKQNYCIYCANPKNPTDPHYDLRYDKWYNEILKVSKITIPATC
jgi:hypothetical protein